MRRLRAVLLPVLLVSLMPVARAQEGADEEATYRVELSAALDRWNDAAPEDRLKRAIEVTEKHLKADAADVSARLDLARFKLAAGDPDGAQAEALRAEREATGDQLAEAKALYLIAYQESMNVHLPSVKEKDRERAQKEFQAKFVELWKKLVEVAKGEPAATRLVQDDQDRIATARTLNLLGKPAPAIDKRDTKDELASLRDKGGKVVLVDFWSAQSKAYADEIANTLAVWERWHAKGLEAIGVSLDKDRALLDAFVKEKKVPWPQVFTGRGLADELAKPYAEKGWSVDRIPRRYLVDHEGKIRFVDVRGEGLEAAVKQLVERAERAKPKKKGE